MWEDAVRRESIQKIGDCEFGIADCELRRRNIRNSPFDIRNAEVLGRMRIRDWREARMGNTRRVAGFTLIEMIIVIMIIAILIGVLLPQFRGTQDEASLQRARSELRTLATALESYYIHNSNAMPSALSSLTSATPRIVNVIPNDPLRGGANAYSYYRDTNNIYYVVFSYGLDRAAAITGISTAGVPQCTGVACTSSIDDACITNGTPPGASNC